MTVTKKGVRVPLSCAIIVLQRLKKKKRKTIISLRSAVAQSETNEYGLVVTMRKKDWDLHFKRYDDRTTVLKRTTLLKYKYYYAEPFRTLVIIFFFTPSSPYMPYSYANRTDSVLMICIFLFIFTITWWTYPVVNFLSCFFNISCISTVHGYNIVCNNHFVFLAIIRVWKSKEP